jgi:hypothetical protein
MDLREKKIGVEKESVSIDLDKFIETYGKFPVLASSDYLLNEFVRTRDDMILINPNSSLGRFFGSSIPDVLSLFPDFNEKFLKPDFDYKDLVVATKKEKPEKEMFSTIEDTSKAVSEEKKILKMRVYLIK